MKKILFLFTAFMLFSSHDMFLKMESFFLQPDVESVLHLYNGTFDRSDNVITRDRMLDVSLLGGGNRYQQEPGSWTEAEDVTILNFQTGSAGTWVAGVSTKPNTIELSAQDFNEYLEHDGVLDMLDWRRENNAMDQPAVEEYSKHVKAIFQVGKARTNDWQKPLGYPIEFVPLDNPYELVVGDTLRIQLLLDNQPLPNQLVYSGFRADSEEHGHDHSSGEEHHHDEMNMTSDADGRVNLEIDHVGQWYVRTIHMTQVEDSILTHESNWATLTFEVQAKVEGQTGSSVVLYLVVAVLLLILFFYLVMRRTAKD